MSAHGGIHCFDGARVDRRTLIAMGDRLSAQGPDSGSVYECGSTGMVHRAFHANAESRLGSQPSVSGRGVVLCLDGRIDNREEMARRAGIRHEECSDSDIVLAVYEKCGIECFSMLIGDYAIAAWDSRSHEVILARDPVGARPLHYHANPRRIAWCSELSPILELFDIPVVVSEEYIAGYLAMGPSPALTPYEGVLAVPPGSLVRARAGRSEIRRHWVMDPGHRVRYGTGAEYEERFRLLFREAVRVRMRADGPIWATLSGGLDSSSIVCMADAIIDCGEAGASRLETVSYVYDNSPHANEIEYINAVECFRGRKGRHFLESEHPMLSRLPDASVLSAPDGMDVFLARHTAVCESMRAEGARVLLAGFGGDEMLGSAPNPSGELGDCLISGRWPALHRSLSAWSAHLRQPYLKVLWRHGLLPLMPRRVQSVFLDGELICPWYDRRFVSRMDLRGRFLPAPETFGMRTPSGRDQAAGFESAVRAVSRCFYRSRGLVEVCYPFLHRPLVEFLLAIPVSEKLRPGENRSLMRRALKGLLPEKILRRKGKKGIEEPLLRALAREWPVIELIARDALVCEYGYVDPTEFRLGLERARIGYAKNLIALIRTLTLEFWLRSLNGFGADYLPRGSRPAARTA